MRVRVRTQGGQTTVLMLGVAAVVASRAMSAGRVHHRLPSFVPPRFHDPIARAALRWNVPMNLLAAQLYAESGFNPFARSPAGAQGIAQFMPGTARSYGLENPFDPMAAIDAQAHLMSDLLKRFGGKVALALAGYNVGAGAVERYGGVPPYAETRAYVARITGLLGGAGDIPVATYEVRLVE
jgi:soluble lytic murein transglycosylase-like protein